MTQKDWISLLIRPKINLIKEEIESVAKLIKEFDCSNEQEIIDYEDFLNKYSNLDYNK